MPGPGGQGVNSLLDLVQQQPQAPQFNYNAPPQWFRQQPAGAGMLGAGGGGAAQGGPPSGSLIYNNPGSFMGSDAFPSNWRDFPNIFFSTGDRNRQIAEAQKALDPNAWGTGPQTAMSSGQGVDATGRPINRPAITDETRRLAAMQPSQFGNYVGADLPSTNDYRVLPPPYNTPGYMMQNGRIIDRSLTNPMKYLQSLGFSFGDQSGSGGWRGTFSGGQAYGYPSAINWGKGGQMVFWPGDVTGSRLITSLETD